MYIRMHVCIGLWRVSSRASSMFHDTHVCMRNLDVCVCVRVYVRRYVFYACIHVCMHVYDCVCMNVTCMSCQSCGSGKLCPAEARLGERSCVYIIIHTFIINKQTNKHNSNNNNNSPPLPSGPASQTGPVGLSRRAGGLQ